MLLVLDEPSAHLDSVMEARVRRVWSCDSGGDSNDSDETTDGDIADGEHDPTASTTKVQQVGQQELDGEMAAWLKRCTGACGYYRLCAQ